MILPEQKNWSFDLRLDLISIIFGKSVRIFYIIILLHKRMRNYILIPDQNHLISEDKNVFFMTIKEFLILI